MSLGYIVSSRPAELPKNSSHKDEADEAEEGVRVTGGDSFMCIENFHPG